MSSELHSQLVTAESEMKNKMKEIQTLHSSLTEAMVSKERLEQRVVEFMEVSQHSIPDESLQARVQVGYTKHRESEHVRNGCKQSNEHAVLQELMNENKDLQVQNENMQAQISSQVSSSPSMISVSSENIQQQTFPLI